MGTLHSLRGQLLWNNIQKAEKALAQAREKNAGPNELKARTEAVTTAKLVYAEAFAGKPAARN
jgi:hypothetical protein